MDKLMISVTRVLSMRLERKPSETCCLHFVHTFRENKSHLFHGWWFTLAIVFCLVFIPSICFAADFDGSKLLVGSVEKVIEINQTKVLDNVDPDRVGLPRRFFIDIEKKIVLPSKDSLVRRISKINHVEHIENKVVLQGVDEGVENVDDSLAWSIVISKKSGKVVLSAAGSGVAYVVFGSCTELE
jgi:hypothetical protein